MDDDVREAPILYRELLDCCFDWGVESVGDMQGFVEQIVTIVLAHRDDGVGRYTNKF